MLTAAVRDLKAAFPDIRVNVNTTAMELWENNPLLDRSISKINADKIIKGEYNIIHNSNNGAYHFIHGFRIDLEKKLGLTIPQGKMCCDLYLNEYEKNSDDYFNSIIKNSNKPVWLINAGFKRDFTCKGWEFKRFQQIVDITSDLITWIQIGSTEHCHAPLRGAINMLGKTTHRQLMNIMYRADGVVTGLSYPMHLATMPMKNFPNRKRPCIVIAGGREPSVWEAYTGHQFVHVAGSMKCCANGGCWKSRVVRLNDGDCKDNSLCIHPVKTGSGQIIPKCMDMISAGKIISLIKMYVLFE